MPLWLSPKNIVDARDLLAPLSREEIDDAVSRTGVDPTNLKGETPLERLKYALELFNGKRLESFLDYLVMANNSLKEDIEKIKKWKDREKEPEQSPSAFVVYLDRVDQVAALPTIKTKTEAFTGEDDRIALVVVTMAARAEDDVDYLLKRLSSELGQVYPPSLYSNFRPLSLPHWRVEQLAEMTRGEVLKSIDASRKPTEVARPSSAEAFAQSLVKLADDNRTARVCWASFDLGVGNQCVIAIEHLVQSWPVDQLREAGLELPFVLFVFFQTKGTPERSWQCTETDALIARLGTSIAQRPGVLHLGFDRLGNCDDQALNPWLVLAADAFGQAFVDGVRDGLSGRPWFTFRAGRQTVAKVEKEVFG